MTARQGLDPMTELQNGWYVGLTRGCGLDPATFQIRLPAAPLEPSDEALWDALNVVPPTSLTFNRSLPGGRRMFDVYATIVGRLLITRETLKDSIGASAYNAWSIFLATVRPPPADTQLPSLFQNWAARNAPQSAAAGVAALSSMILLASAMRALAPYQKPNAKPADFSGGYIDLTRRLGAGAGASVFFDSHTTPGDVRDAWTGGVNVGFDGLWPGSSADSRPSRMFAESRVTVSAQFRSFVRWTATPGAWCNSSLLNVAFSVQGSPPWRSDYGLSWSDFFGPNGEMLHALATAIVVDGVELTLTSDAAFDPEDQQAILDNASGGFWPLYAPASGEVDSSVGFGDDGGMQIRIATKPGRPIALGAEVLSIARYLGHAG